MTNAPENAHLRKVIRDLVDAQFWIGQERILFLGHEGELREVLYPNEGITAIRNKRDTMLRDGRLGAIVHLRMSTYRTVGLVSMVEIFEDTDQPTVHTIVNWPRHGRWMPPSADEKALNRWRTVWQPAGEEEDET
jgi:hypothetical protein